uniref:DYW_deaminase domain-containing protein n=1 Tax=Heterorhabditis bacteriophora TaxID=37862 RepID=A0A1I7XTL5_HETBA
MSKALHTTIIHLHELGEKHIAIAKKLCHENGSPLDCGTISAMCVNTACNSQNRRQLLQHVYQRSEKASVNSRSHFQLFVIVWAGMSASDKTPLVFVEEMSKNSIFQQDWAPAHGAKTTVELNRQFLRQRHLAIKLTCSEFDGLCNTINLGK